MDPTTQTQEPTPTQTQAPTTDPAPAAPQEPQQQSQEPNVNDPAPATFADPEPQPQHTEPQQTTEPQSPTEPEPSEPTEPGPDTRVVPKPSEYELPEGMPDNIRIFAHEKGFTQDQLNATIEQFGGYLYGMQQAEQQSLQQMGQAHLKNWGPDAKNKLALARAAVRQNDSEGKIMNLLNQSGYGNHPDVLNFLYQIGKSMQEGGFIKSAVPRKPGEKTAAQAMYGDNHPSSEG